MIRISIVKRKKDRLFEFSKKVVVIMTILIFVSAVFAGIIIYKNNGLYLDSYLDYIRSVGGTAIFGYLAKVCFENPQKIKNGGANSIDKQ